MNQLFSQQLLLIKTAVILPLDGFFCNCPYSPKSEALCTLLSFME